MRDRIVNALRRWVEDVLPWYSPEREAAKDKEVNAAVVDAHKAVDKLGSYARARVRR